MNKLGGTFRRNGAAALRGILLVALLAGCGPQPEPSPAGADPRPATQPRKAPGRPAPERPPLPRKALLSLDELTPKIDRPQDKPYPRELPAQAKVAMDEAGKLLEQGKTPPAIQKLERALGFDPANPHVHRELGLAYMRMSNLGKARKHLQEAVEYLRDDIHVQALLGQIAGDQGRTDEAIRRLRTALKCSDADPAEPRTGLSLLLLAQLLQRQGYATAALESYRRLDKWVEEHSSSYTNNDTLKQLVLNPEMFLAVHGRLLMQLRRPAEAIEPLQKAYRRNRAARTTSRLLLEALVETDQHDRAARYIADMAREPALRGMLPAIAGRLCAEADRPGMPTSLWESIELRVRKEAPALGLALAAAAARNDRPAAARRICRDILSAQPGYVPASAMLAGLAARQGELEEAMRLLAQRLQKDSAATGLVAEGIRAILPYLKPGDERDVAAVAMRDQSKLRPALLYVAGRIAWRLDKRYIAEKCFRDAITAREEFRPAYEALVDLYLRANDQAQVDRLLKTVDKLDGDGYFANYLRGKVLMARGEMEKALTALLSAARKNPNHLPTILLLNDAQIRLGKLDDAVTWLKRAAERFPHDSEPHRRLFEIYLLQRKFEPAGKVAEKLLSQMPHSAQGPRMRIELLMATGRHQEARRRLQQFLEQFPDAPDLQVLQVRLDRDEYKGLLPKSVFDDVVARLNEIIREHRDNRLAKRQLADVLTDHGHDLEATPLWAKLSEAEPGNRQYRERHIMGLLQAGQPRAALRPAERFLNYSPNSITAQSLMLRVLEAMSQWQRAEQLVKRWIGRTGDELRRQAYAHQLVSIYQAARQWDKADEWIQKQIKSADDDEQRLRWQTSRLLLHARAERWKDFLKTAKAWMARYPDNIGIREMVVSLLLEGHRYKLADELLSDWQKAAPLRPGRAMPGLAATTLDLRISWFSYQQKHKQALKLVEERIGQLTQILQDTPQNQYATQRLADLKNRRAGLLAEMGQNDKAMALMETALDKDPENASLNNNLAYRYSEEAIKLDKAEKMVQKAIDISGPIIAYVDTKAWVYYKTGRISEAAELLVGIVRQEDLSDDPVVHPVIYDHTGDALYRLGWKAWALQIWRQSLELAGKQKYKDSDAQRLQKLLPLKIQAVEAGREPNIAPLAPAGAAALDAKADSNAPPAGDGRTPPNP